MSCFQVIYTPLRLRAVSTAYVGVRNEPQHTEALATYQQYITNLIKLILLDCFASSDYLLGFVSHPSLQCFISHKSFKHFELNA